MRQGCSNLVLYPGRAKACSFGAGRSGSQAYLHLHIIWCKLFHGRLFLAALNHISDSNHAPGYSRTELWHWVYGMMLLTKQIGTYAKAKCPRISNSNGKSTMIHTGRYDSSDKIKLPYSLLLHKIACNRTQNNSCVKSCTLIHSLMQVNIVLLQTQWSTFLPSDWGIHRQCSTSHWTNPIVPKLHRGWEITLQLRTILIQCSF